MKNASPDTKNQYASSCPHQPLPVFTHRHTHTHTHTCTCIAHQHIDNEPNRTHFQCTYIMVQRESSSGTPTHKNPGDDGHDETTPHRGYGTSREETLWRKSDTGKRYRHRNTGTDQILFILCQQLHPFHEAAVLQPCRV
jgi:hypothetical protein